MKLTTIAAMIAAATLAGCLGEPQGGPSDPSPDDRNRTEPPPGGYPGGAGGTPTGPTGPPDPDDTPAPLEPPPPGRRDLAEENP